MTLLLQKRSMLLLLHSIELCVFAMMMISVVLTNASYYDLFFFAWEHSNMERKIEQERSEALSQLRDTLNKIRSYSMQE